MTNDEPRELAEGLASFQRADRIAPDHVLEEYAERAFDKIPVAEDDPTQLTWGDPRTARFRRAVAAEANKKGNARRRAREAEAKVEALQQQLDDAYGLVELTGANYQALEERFKETYVALKMLEAQKSVEDESGDDSQSPPDPPD